MPRTQQAETHLTISIQVGIEPTYVSTVHGWNKTLLLYQYILLKWSIMNHMIKNASLVLFPAVYSTVARFLFSLLNFLLFNTHCCYIATFKIKYYGWGYARSNHWILLSLRYHKANLRSTCRTQYLGNITRSCLRYILLLVLCTLQQWTCDISMAGIAFYYLGITTQCI